MTIQDDLRHNKGSLSHPRGGQQELAALKGNMDEKIIDEILDELFSSFEKSETDSAAILLLLRERGMASEEKLAPFIEQASRMSEVRWRAARVRMSALLKSAMKTSQPPAEQKIPENQDQKKKATEEKKESADKEPTEMKQSEEKKPDEKKKEPEKNQHSKADVQPEKESEKAAKSKPDDSQPAPENNKPTAGETESSRNNSRNKAEHPEKETEPDSQQSTKPADSSTKAEKK
jgi:hypothetical protein